MHASSSVSPGALERANEEEQNVLSYDQEGELQEEYCGGCHKLIDEESVDDGIIQFATKLWHIDCFRCAKCKNKVSTDRDDILLLSDGHPICGECNYSCNICGLPIMEEAIMTGDESYHASCFTCRSCHSKIEELIFAKTSQGIYCMQCHNERVARSRKHAEHKKAKARREQQLKDAEAASAKAGGESSRTLTSGVPFSGKPSPSGSSSGLPTIAVDEERHRRQEGSRSYDAPPTLPSKESRSPASTVQPTALQSSSSLNNVSTLSPWAAGPAIPRPGSSNGKRPMQAPPLPLRETRSPAASRTPLDSARSNGRLEERGNAPASSGSSASIASFTTAQGADPVSAMMQRSGSHDRSAEASRRSLTLRQGEESYDSTGVSKNGTSIDTTIRRQPQDDATNGASTDSKPTSRFSSSSEMVEPSTRNGSDPSRNVDGSPSRSRKAGADKNSLTASASSSRLSKTFSFYDPEFLNLMDTFGRFNSNDDFKLSSPVVEELADNQLASAPATSRAAKRMSVRPPLPPSREESNRSPEITLARVQESLEVEASDEKYEEEQRDSTSSLTSLSAKMRASMKLARDGQVNMDISFVEMVLKDLDETREKMLTLQTKYDRIKRASQQAALGFSMAKEEYEQEVNARHEAEMEMARLQRRLVDQAFKLATMSSEKRQQEQLERRSQDIKASLKGMERDLAKLTVERDLTVAEVAELLAIQDGTAPATSSDKDAAISNNLASRLESVKAKYRKEIDELSLERDSLLIEIEELKQLRELYHEEAQSLNAKNEELNSMIGQLTRRMEMASMAHGQMPSRISKDLPPFQHQQHNRGAGGGFGFGFGRPSKHQMGSSVDSASIIQAHDMVSIDSAVQKVIKPEKIEPAPMAKKFKWMKPKLSDVSKVTSASAPGGQNGALPPVPPKISAPTPATSAAAQRNVSHDMVVREHLFQPFNVLRPTRCIACQKNMWGQSEMRCALCAQICHTRCLQNLSLSCHQPYTRPEDASSEPQGPSMFGKDLVEQAALEFREVPLVVEKCIQAVESFGMDYEGIYRKSGGSSQLKVITQLFERGAAFDLQDQERFNDISAITSVLKNYFRELPVPLLTFDLHEEFIRLAEAKKDAGSKRKEMGELIARLPRQHFATLRHLVLHLNRVQKRSEENRMNARNLGVVFGPTLMKSGDPTQEFAHMGGKAMTIEYFIEHADNLFA